MAEFNMGMEFDSKNNIRSVADTNVVLHCHHYNSQLQQTLELTDYIDGIKIIKDAGEEVFFRMLSSYLHKNKVADSEKLGVAAEMYRKLGFGTLDFSHVSDGVVFGLTSHFCAGWLCKFGERMLPCCHFTSGYIAGVYRAATGKHYEVEEKECTAMGAKKCKFVLKEIEANPSQVALKKVEFVPQKPLACAIDEERIIESMSELQLEGGEEGFIPAFGVYLTIMPSDFYNRISYNFERELQALEMSLGRSAKELLIYAGVVCGLNTLDGILKSQEWAALVEPMIKNQEDKIYGMTAVTNVLGWGKWQVMEVVPDKKLVMRAYNPYEALGYLGMFGRATEPKCYMLTGIAASMMELTYTDEKLRGKYDFIAEETKCIAKGDAYCEFVARKNE